MFDKTKMELEEKAGHGWQTTGINVETALLDLGREVSALEIDEAFILLILARTPTLFYEDLLFFLFVTEVVNGNVADFDYLPEPTSLELAYAIQTVGEELAVIGGEEFSAEIKAFVKHTLTEEGYSIAPPPFGALVDQSELTEGQTKEDSEAKAMAIQAYILAKKREDA